MAIRRFPVILAVIVLTFTGNALAACPAGQVADPATGQCISDIQAGVNAGNALGNQAAGFYGSTGTFNQQISQPAISSNTPMSTISGTTFNGQIVCPSSSKFMEVTAIPTATGDIAVTVKQQTNFNNPPGTFDHIYTLPAPLSGVCANGFIACDAGTWNSCKYYAWGTLPNSAAITIKPVGVNSVGGCFCVNGSCGYTLAASNYGYILGVLGGGMAAAVQASAPELAVSRSDVTPPTATFYGQQSGSCASAAGPAGSSSTPQQYWGGNGNVSPSLTSDASNAMTASPFYAGLQSLQMATTGSYTANTCDLARSWSVGTRTQSVSKTGSGSICVVSDVSAGIITAAGTDIYDIRFGATSFAGYPNCPSSSPMTVDSVDLASISLSLPAGSVSSAIFKGVSGNAHYTATGCNPYTSLISSTGAMIAIAGCSAVGYHYGTYDYSLTFDYMYDIETDTLNNGCTSYANDPNCQLKDEYEYDAQGNGVQSYQGFQPTGLHVLASSSARNTSIAAYTKTHNWWRISRTYLCKGSNNNDITNVKKRVGIIANSTAPYAGGTTQTYADYQCDAQGNCQSSAENIQIDPAMTGNSPAQCENACKVRVDTQATGAAASGNQSQYNASTSGAVYLFRVCVDGGTTCPYDASKGESPVANANGGICHCTSEFTQSATALAGLMAAGHSLICSSNHKCPAGQKWDATQGKCI